MKAQPYMEQGDEDDADALAVTPIPAVCVKWPCSKNGAQVIQVGAFYVCESCKASYGRKQ